MRKVHVGAEVWEYEIGKSYASIRDPNGKRKVVPLGEIKASIIEARRFDRDVKISITPADISDYIERNLLP